MVDSAKLEDLIKLFRETREAHHQAYIDSDGAHPDWPMWYAGHMHERITALLGASFTQSELVYLLVWLDGDIRRRAPGADWATYYARRLLERYG